MFTYEPSLPFLSLSLLRLFGLLLMLAAVLLLSSTALGRPKTTGPLFKSDGAIILAFLAFLASCRKKSPRSFSQAFLLPLPSVSDFLNSTSRVPS